jgi:hypothetical protein
MKSLFAARYGFAIAIILLLSAVPPASAQEKINVNTASQEELAGLPGMSKKKVAKLIAGRPYSSASDLSKSGLTAKQIDKITPLLSFEGGATAAAPSPEAAETPAHGRKHAASAATASSAEETTTAQTPPQPGMVWVTKKTKIYHEPGDRWYGKTKHGEWMTEADAIKAGYRKAK